MGGMDIRRRLRGFTAPASIPGWGMLIWKGLDAIDVASFVAKGVDDVWNFLTSSVGDIVVILIGLVIIFYAARHPDKNWSSWRRARVEPGGADRVVDMEPWVRRFDRFFETRMNTMSLRHLWNDAGTDVNMEPSLGFQLVVTNNTPIPVFVTGCQGQATIDGDQCTLPAILEGGGFKLDPWTYGTPNIKQPLLTDKGRELVRKIGDQESIQVSLGPILLLVEDGDGLMPNRPMAVGVSFNIDPRGISVEHAGISNRPLIMGNP